MSSPTGDLGLADAVSPLPEASAAMGEPFKEGVLILLLGVPEGFTPRINPLSPPPDSGTGVGVEQIEMNRTLSGGR